MAPDFINFEPTLYRLKVTRLTDEQLQRKEVIKIRIAYSGTFGIVGGTVLAPVTAGVTLIGAAASGRTWYVTSQKLEIIQAELERRGLPLHKERKRDSAIPAIFSGLTGGMNMAVGLDGSLVSQAAGIVANKTAVSPTGLGRIRTAPSRLMPPHREISKLLRRSHTDTEIYQFGVRRLPPTSEEYRSQRPASAPDEKTKKICAINRKITICLALVVCYWILRLSMLRLVTRVLILTLLGFGVHARLLWDYEMYPLHPSRFAKLP